mmetsp:Transcript_26046/g.56854  ORF Transcript_26046/g.56854 Transcript_26046/m.56854 type:complete len:161 (+) Transcript_26046:71-553(+)
MLTFSAGCTTVPRLRGHKQSLVSAHRRVQPRVVPARSIGKDAVDAWLDLSKLVAGSGGNKTPYDELASAIGKDVYVDIAGWHLYLRDMTATPGLKMSQALAQQLGPQASRGLRESDVEAVLKKIPIKVGAGKLRVSLYDVTPSMCIADLTRILEDFARRK